jgi:hypothetical protein
MTEILIETASCSLSDDQLAERKEELRSGFVKRIVAARELPDGIALGFPGGGEMRAEIEEFIEFERDCCSFAVYQVRRGEGDDRQWLEIRGPVGTRGLMRRLVPATVAVEMLENRGRAAQAGVTGDR